MSLKLCERTHVPTALLCGSCISSLHARSPSLSLLLCLFPLFLFFPSAHRQKELRKKNFPPGWSFFLLLYRRAPHLLHPFSFSTCFQQSQFMKPRRSNIDLSFCRFFFFVIPFAGGVSISFSKHPIYTTPSLLLSIFFHPLFLSFFSLPPFFLRKPHLNEVDRMLERKSDFPFFPPPTFFFLLLGALLTRGHDWLVKAVLQLFFFFFFSSGFFPSLLPVSFGFLGFRFFAASAVFPFF